MNTEIPSLIVPLWNLNFNLRLPRAPTTSLPSVSLPPSLPRFSLSFDKLNAPNASSTPISTLHVHHRPELVLSMNSQDGGSRPFRTSGQVRLRLGFNQKS